MAVQLLLGDTALSADASNDPAWAAPHQPLDLEDAGVLSDETVVPIEAAADAKPLLHPPTTTPDTEGPAHPIIVQWDAVLARVLKLKPDAHLMSEGVVSRIHDLLGDVLEDVSESKAEFPSPLKLPPNIRSCVETQIAMGTGMPRKKKPGRKAPTSKANVRFLE